MSVWEALLLSVVQGVTEFLPISSSAHLVLAPYLLGWEEHDLTFDVVTNLGTLLAAVAYFRHDLAASIRGGTSGLVRDDGRPGLLLAVAVGTIPAALVGLLFYDFLSTTARNPTIIAATSIGFGLLLLWSDRAGRRERGLESLGWLDTVLIGCAQALALVPGTSRSGITMTAALFRGWTREDAARFSFLLAIPIGLLAFAKDTLDLVQGGLPEATALVALVVGFIGAGLSAYLVIGWLLAWLARQTMTIFVVYRVLLGLLVLAVAYWR